jgi:hypothetical protein
MLEYKFNVERKMIITPHITFRMICTNAVTHNHHQNVYLVNFTVSGTSRSDV